jgi:hypothetical protein
MSVLLRTIVALAVLAVTVPVTGFARADEADAKACKSGKIVDPDTGKCVTPRGS